VTWCSEEYYVRYGCYVYFSVLERFICRFRAELEFNTTYHPHPNSQTEKVNMILEDMLTVYVMHQQKIWEKYLPLLEFSYKNGH